MLDITDFDALTFDCYGTLIDWEEGIGSRLERWARESNLSIDRDALLELFARRESQFERDHPSIPYRDILLSVHGAIAEELGVASEIPVTPSSASSPPAARHSGIPVYILAMLAFVKPLFGIKFDDNLKYLFRDHHVMRLCGFNFKQIRGGYSKRTTKDGKKPIHQDSVRNFLKSLGYAQTTGLLMKVVRKLYKLGLMRGGTYNTDTKVIFKDSPGYEFAKKVYDYKGKHKNRRGYKVSIVQHAKSKIVVAIVITSANVSDKNLLLTTVRQAVTILGPAAIKTLVFDKGYWDGATMGKLKHKYGIDFVVPAKANLKVTKRLKKQAKYEDFEKIRKGLRIKFEKSVEDAPNYEGNLRAIVVKDAKAKKKRKSKQPVHVYLTSLSWDSSVAIYKAYRERWFIENNAIRELCQYWFLEDFHCTKFNAIRAHVLICAVMFNLHVLFISKYGKRFCEKTISAKRAPAFEPTYIVVYYKDYFGIFDVKEYTDLICSEELKPP